MLPAKEFMKRHEEAIFRQDKRLKLRKNFTEGEKLHKYILKRTALFTDISQSPFRTGTGSEAERPPRWGGPQRQAGRHGDAGVAPRLGAAQRHAGLLKNDRI